MTLITLAHTVTHQNWVHLHTIMFWAEYQKNLILIVNTMYHIIHEAVFCCIAVLMAIWDRRQSIVGVMTWAREEEAQNDGTGDQGRGQGQASSWTQRGCCWVRVEECNLTLGCLLVLELWGVPAPIGARWPCEIEETSESGLVVNRKGPFSSDSLTSDQYRTAFGTSEVKIDTDEVFQFLSSEDSNTSQWLLSVNLLPACGKSTVFL